MEKRSMVLILVLSVAVVFSMASNCPAPFCGDGVLRIDYGEVCDPGGWQGPGTPPPDDAACPGQCLPDCTCPETPTITPATVSPTECQEVVTVCPATVTTCVDDPTYCPMLTYCGGEGCTPGYWKQIQHFGNWVDYSPSDLFSSVFEDAFPGKTLLQVMWQGGGGLNALGRHTVAALLNAASPDVDYDMSPEDVIAAFNEVFPDGDYEGLKMQLEDFNEQGCPLGVAFMMQ